jgi:CheY-like chemotaxis protein
MRDTVEQRRPSEPDRGPGRRKLLLADGSAAVQRVVELMFSAEGVEVVAIDDGQQAIDRLPFEAPDVVLADIAAPRRSGYEIAAFVARHPQLSRVPVLLLAGAFEPVDEARAARVRSAGVLVKPLEPHQVVTRVRGLLDSNRPPSASSTSDSPAAAQAAVARHPDTRTAPDAAPASEPPRGGGLGPRASRDVETPHADPGATSLDDYFDRLDAALATLGTRQPPVPAAASSPLHVEGALGGADIPTVEDVLGAIDHGAVEMGETDAGAVAADLPAAQVTDELVDRVTRRVVERLGTAAVRDLVGDVVARIAERLVREEIDRIRRG